MVASVKLQVYNESHAMEPKTILLTGVLEAISDEESLELFRTVALGKQIFTIL
jgi:hypothetical protein